MTIALLSRFLNTGSCRTWLVRGPGAPPRRCGLPGLPLLASHGTVSAAAPRAPPGSGGGPGAASPGPALPPVPSYPPPPRGRRAPPDWPQRGDPGKVPRRREAARRQPRRMGGRAGFFEVGAGGAASRRGEPGPGPAASCRRRTGLPGVPADGSLLPLLLH